MRTVWATIAEYGRTHDIAETDALARKLLGLDGGEGSGNFGHKGRPGKVGGSGEGEESEIMPSGGPETSSGESKADELYQKLEKARERRDKANKKADELKEKAEGWVDRILEAQENGNLDEVMKEYKSFQKEYSAATKEYSDAYNAVEEARKAYEAEYEGSAVAKEQKEIEKSGLSEADWRRKKAVQEYGYTTDFREAGYMLPNGKCLNFCGSKGQHYGMRGNDHRDIAGLYAAPSYGGSKEMVRFMADGNIRVYAEAPGVDISTTLEPTPEQYRQIEKMADQFAKERYFSVDLTDENGKTVGSLEYEGRINPIKVSADIKYFFRNGKVPEKSTVSQFHSDDKKAAKDGGPGSGNHGHAGRPGKVGGSAPDEGGSAIEPGSAPSNSGSSSENKPESKPTKKEILEKYKPGEEFKPEDVWAFLTADPDEEEERSYAEAAKKALESLGNSYHMKGIVEAAKANKDDYHAFVRAMSTAQKEALREQYKASGSEEHFTDYVKRMQKMLTEVEYVPPQENKVVQGKDIAESYEYQGTEWSGKAGSEEIDTQIEDVIHQQGFDGVPKVVSKDEFDKITEEHPEMPILIRAYTAQNAETLQKYNEDLEKGFFYVDCGVGGAQYGQGMYCAGVYRPQADERVLQWNDPELRDSFDDDFVFKDNKGQGYITKLVSPENGDDLYVDTLYMFVDDKTQEPRLLQRDYESLVWEDASTGAMIHDDEVDDMINSGAIFECRKINIEPYEERNKRQKEEALKAASEEADHYLKVGINRLLEDYKPELPEGKEAVLDRSTETYFSYDPKEKKTFEESKPEEGQLIISGKNVYRVMKGGKCISNSGSYFYTDAVSDAEWAPVEDRIDTFTPQGNVRKMTLDPSAKIITHDDLLAKMSGTLTSNEEKSVVDEYFEKHASETGLSGAELEYLRIMYNSDAGYVDDLGTTRHSRLQKNISEEDRGLIETQANRMARNMAITDLRDAENKAREKAREYGKFRDPGALAAALGYDAINAEGHGETMSYTVVLNRTKVILQKETM